MSATGHAAAGLSLGWTLVLLGLLVVYTAGFRRLQKAEPAAASGWRLAGFLAGLLSLWAALASPLAQLDHQRLFAHMLQHLWVMNVAAPLLLLAEPLRTLEALAPGVCRALGTPRLRPLLRLLTHPLVCWLSGTTVVLLFHLPAVLQRTLASPVWHTAQQASFLVAGLLFWWPVVLPWPGRARWPRLSLLLYLFLATLPCDALSAFLAFSGRVVYPHYLEGHPSSGGGAALADQQAAGALMWCVVTLVYLSAAVAIALERLVAKPGAGRDVAAS
ncbi:MAG: cytochrome c oxidase assembly protein [Myxococcaceae bacterium]